MANVTGSGEWQSNSLNQLLLLNRESLELVETGERPERLAREA